MRRKKRNHKVWAKIFKPGQSKYLVISFTNFKDGLLICLPLLLLIGFFYLLNSPVFQVKSISCFKADLPCNEAESAAFDGLKHKNIFFLNSKGLEQEFLEANPYIDKLSFQQRLPDGLVIHLFTRQPSFMASIDRQAWFLIDDQGVVLAEAVNNPDLPRLVFSSVYKLEVGRQLSGLLAQKAFLLVRTLKLFFIPFESIEVKFPDQLELQTGATKVVLTSDKNLKYQVASLQLILSRSRIEGKTPNKIDLRFDKPVVFFN
ncbi:hypothetical protein KKD62_00420 [Patescibacteria group bacterium]|nr:hypothetical protein [Patescibacteria group bacterium]MBU1931748.1 hypothetical protein [Patescibacteria group bacterium]